MGIKIKTSENEWSMENIYMEEKTSIYRPGSELPKWGYTVDKRVQDIYENAEWMLKPTEDTYHIWMDEYVESLERTIEPVEMFRLVDQTTGTEIYLLDFERHNYDNRWLEVSRKKVELWSEKKNRYFMWNHLYFSI